MKKLEIYIINNIQELLIISQQWTDLYPCLVISIFQWGKLQKFYKNSKILDTGCGDTAKVSIGW